MNVNKNENKELLNKFKNSTNNFQVLTSNFNKISDNVIDIQVIINEIIRENQNFKNFGKEISFNSLIVEIEKLNKFKLLIDTIEPPEELIKFAKTIENQLITNKDVYLKENKAQFWYKLGDVLSCAARESEAIEPLNKAVKLDPKLLSCWNLLGECYWSNQQVDLAQRCFEHALSIEKNKISLRNLSIIMRKLASNSRDEQSKDFIEKGIKFAKDAVSLDVEDGVSWGILGNAYLKAYFSKEQNSDSIKLALTAYKRAENIPYNGPRVELYFNHAYASKYSGHYEDALQSLEKAIKFDNKWEIPQKLLESLWNYLIQIITNIDSLGKIRAKKMSTYKKELSKLLSKPEITKFGKQVVAATALQNGENKDLALLGIVLWIVSNDTDLPFTCGILDPTNNISVLTIYNVTLDKGFIIGDRALIFDPILQTQNFTFKNKNFKFLNIRVDNPTKILINNQPIKTTQITPFTMNTSSRYD